MTYWNQGKFELVNFILFARKYQGKVLLFYGIREDLYLITHCKLIRDVLHVYLPDAKKSRIVTPNENSGEGELVLWEPDLDSVTQSGLDRKTLVFTEIALTMNQAAKQRATKGTKKSNKGGMNKGSGLFSARDGK